MDGTHISPQIEQPHSSNGHPGICLERRCIWWVWSGQSRFHGVPIVARRRVRSFVFSPRCCCSLSVTSGRKNHWPPEYPNRRSGLRDERNCHDYAFPFRDYDGRGTITVSIAGCNGWFWGFVDCSACSDARSTGTRSSVVGCCDVCFCRIGIASEQQGVWSRSVVVAARWTSCFPTARITHSVPGFSFRFR
jgi:hypothetical protein